MSKNTKLFTGFVVMGLALSLVVVSTASAFTFTQTLKLGSTGSEVMELQKVLNSDVATQVAATGVGSKGNETTYFGGLTKAAVIKFQNKYASEVLAPIGLTSGTGLVGAMTRAKLTSLSSGMTGGTTGGTTGGSMPAGCSAGYMYSPINGQPCSGGTTVVTPTGTGLSVTDPGQPGPSLAPESAARIPFTKVRLTAGNDGDVTVNSLTVERTGLGNNAVFSGIVLLDENGMQIGDAKTLNSNNQAMVGTPFTVKAGTSRVVTIAGNTSSNLDAYAGQVVTLSVVGVNTNGATVSGVLPVTGAAHTINATLSLSSITTQVSSYDPGSSSNKEIGTTGYKFAGIRLTNSGSAEKIRLWSIRWYQAGSAGSSDLANMKTYVDSVAYDTVVSADGKYYTSTFPGGIIVDKGLSKDLWIAGDIVGSSSAGRDIRFDIYKTTDLYVTGETFGYGIAPAAGSSSASDATSELTAGTPWFHGSKVTVQAGSATSITKSTAVPAQNIAINVPNQVLGGFETDIKGEPLSVQSLVFNLFIGNDTANADVEDITNITIVDQNGAVVAGPVDGSTGSTDSIGTVTFTDTVTIPVGKRVWTLKGKLGTDFTNNQTINASTTPSSQWTNVTGLVTGNTITLTNGNFIMNTMTVKAGALAITVSPTPVAQTIVAGGDREFAKYQLDASQSGEDVRVSSIPLLLTFSGGAANSNLSNCQLYDSGTSLTTGSNTVNPDVSSGSSETFTFDNTLTIAKGTVKTLTLKCNVQGSTTSGSIFAWGIASSPSITTTGVTSGNDITETVTQSNGQNQTIGAGYLTVSVDADSPSYAVVAANTTGNTAGIYKFRATNEAVNLNKIGLTLTNTASSSASDLVKVTVWNGSTYVGEAVFTGSNTTATTSTFATPFVLPKDTDVKLTFKVDLSATTLGAGGAAAGAIPGHLIAVDVNSNDTTGTEGTGSESGNTVNLATSGSSASTGVAGVRVFKSYPTVAKISVPTNTLNNGTMSLMRFKVTAAPQGDVGIAKFTLRIATTTATISSLNIYAYTDSGFSSPVTGLSSGGQMENNDLGGSVWASSATDIEIDALTSAGASTTVQVPAGSSRYFDVIGTVAGATTGASVSTQLQGDAGYPSLAAFMGTFSSINGDTNNDFIWSPNSTTTSAVTTVDWTNGYGVSGLPTQNLSAEVLSK